MEYPDFPGNSKTDMSKTTKKSAASGVIMQPSETKKIANAMIGGTLTDVKNHTIYDVVIPEIKRLIMDAISILLNGDVRRSTTPIASKTSYTSFWSGGGAIPVPKVATATPSIRFENYDIGFRDLPGCEEDETKTARGQAIAARDALDEILDRFHKVYVADLYDVCELPTPPHTANNYGWTNLRGMEVVKTNIPDTPWALKMPKPTQIN